MLLKAMMRKILLPLLSVLTLWAATGVQAADTNVDNFDRLKGWWIGTGRLGFTNGKTEEVKCRATYDVRKTENQDIRQVVRCASPSGNVEVESFIEQNGEALTGTWIEKRYELAGELNGSVLPDGFRVMVNGKRLTAEMTITLRKDKHIVEIQFMDGRLLGLSMVFARKL